MSNIQNFQRRRKTKRFQTPRFSKAGTNTPVSNSASAQSKTIAKDIKYHLKVSWYLQLLSLLTLFTDEYIVIKKAWSLISYIKRTVKFHFIIFFAVSPGASTKMEWLRGLIFVSCALCAFGKWEHDCNIISSL